MSENAIRVNGGRRPEGSHEREGMGEMHDIPDELGVSQEGGSYVFGHSEWDSPFANLNLRSSDTE